MSGKASVAAFPRINHLPQSQLYAQDRSSPRQSLDTKGIHTILVGGIPTPLKNMTSSVGMIIPYMKWTIKVMFETTNQ
jgi:hypothetical protein